MRAWVWVALLFVSTGAACPARERPAPPTLSLEPSSPTRVNTPTIRCEPDCKMVFLGATCRTPATGQFILVDGGYAFLASVPDDSTTEFTARRDTGSVEHPNWSPCSAPVRYVEDSLSPAPPRFEVLAADGGAGTIRGLAEPGAAVDLFDNGGCRGIPVATTVADSDGGFALPAGSCSSPCFARAADPAGNASACSDGRR